MIGDLQLSRAMYMQHLRRALSSLPVWLAQQLQVRKLLLLESSYCDPHKLRFGIRISRNIVNIYCRDTCYREDGTPYAEHLRRPVNAS
jgi:hypothetical protein